MGVQIIHDQMDFACLSIDFQCQESYEGHEIGFGAPLSHFHLAMTALGFHRHKQVPCISPLVFVVFFGNLARSCWDRATGLLQQLLTLFIQANHRLGGIIGLGIQTQQLVHPLPIVGGDSPDAPHHFAPRFTDVFFRIWRMLSRLMPSNLGRCRAAMVSDRTVQRAAPSGGWLHAKATTSASWLVPYLAGWPGRAAS